MLNRVQIDNIDDFFVELSKRKKRGVYFCRFSGYNHQIHNFIRHYYESARQNGVIIEGKLQNPDINNLAYYNEIMGSNFQCSLTFINSSLKKWLPRMTGTQVENVAASIYSALLSLKESGKNDNILKNTYIKFMCWLYYKFERIVGNLSAEKIPKILYEGSIGNHELLLMNVLSNAGCDIVLLQYNGDSDYLKIDPASSMSDAVSLPNMTSFPEQFSLKLIRKEIQEEYNAEHLYGPKPQIVNCTNAWISGKYQDDVLLNASSRGSDNSFFYNCFYRIGGVEDKLTYENELYQLQLEIKNRKRHIVIVNNTIEVPSTDEISNIRRKPYQNISQLIADLSANIQYAANPEMQRIMVKAFVDVLLEESKKNAESINKLTNKAVYLLCWLRRYEFQLFPTWKKDDTACFFYLGGCRNENEALFLRYISRLPVDVLIFCPNLNQKCCLDDSTLFEINYTLSLNIEKYPEDNLGTHVGTTAYHAERELDTLMYQDTGMYRNQQYEKANTISLHTMYEEISILWEQELKYRPNFSTVDDVVNIPVIFSKVCGVKDGVIPVYWSEIKNLLTPDTCLVKNVPSITSTSANPIKAFATEFYKNGRLQKTKIKGHKAYQYGFLRETMQDYLLEKIQLLIEQKLIKGTFENGTEYTIISVCLNLDKSALRMIQSFDFTKKNPKIVYVITGETIMSLEDSIKAAFLNLIGFDIVFFVPTGYQCIEKYFNTHVFEEHQIGEYVYDLQIPDFDTISASSTARPSWRERIFKRGN